MVKKKKKKKNKKKNKTKKKKKPNTNTSQSKHSPHRVLRSSSRARTKALADDHTVPYDIVAHSFGCLVALRLATTYPARVRSLALLSPPAFATAQKATAHFGGRWPTRLVVHHPWFMWLGCQIMCKPVRHVYAPLMGYVARLLSWCCGADER
jgi:pimeloyl-ACP methyl ester carboxylesterase